ASGGGTGQRVSARFRAGRRRWTPSRPCPILRWTFPSPRKPEEYPMSLALALLLCAAPAAAGPNTNLDFGAGTLDGWEGEGFYVTAGAGHGPSLACGVSSSDLGRKGHTALLHRTFVVPPGGGYLRCAAHAVRPKDCSAEGQLDVLVFAAGKKIIPRQVRAGEEWRPAPSL